MRLAAPVSSALVLTLMSLLGFAPSAPAADDRVLKGDQLRMVPAPAERAANRPFRGMSMDKVQAQYGAPARKVTPVGQPPIERWEYPTFTVYFEYQKVIHAVAKLQS
jgi:hypothetical protein